MNIFESLENLNVSEKCFEDIIGLVEKILSEDVWNQIEKVHGRPEYKSDWTGTPRPVNKSAELTDKADKNWKKERTLAAYRETNDETLPVDDYFLGRALKKIRDKRTHYYGTKNKVGERKTKERRPHKGMFNHKSPKEQVEASIARYKAKEEKKNK